MSPVVCDAEISGGVAFVDGAGGGVADALGVAASADFAASAGFVVSAGFVGAGTAAVGGVVAGFGVGGGAGFEGGLGCWQPVRNANTAKINSNLNMSDALAPWIDLAPPRGSTRNRELRNPF